jgi:hypothetical protein
MNTTSFQTNHYNHLQQTQIQGQSGLKILAGEDLSNNLLIQLMEIGRDYSKCNRMHGGNSRWKKEKESLTILKWKK